MNVEILGIFFSFVGSIVLIRGFFITKKEAIRLGVSRLCSKKDEENLKLPAVRDRLKQRTYGVVGAIFLAIGFIFQFLSII